MSIIVIGISFILIWLGTSFFIVRYVIKLRNDLIGRFPEKKNGDTPVEDDIFKPFDSIKHADPKCLFNFIQQEHPQVIALVLAYLEPYKASVILQNFPREVQVDVSRRIATTVRADSEVMRQIEWVLNKKLSALPHEKYTAAGGIDRLVEILNYGQP
jgi:flagellar motor switch protein FliG